jgi:hypothetical protein
MRRGLLAVLVPMLLAVPAAEAKPRKCASVEYTRESGYLVYGSSQIRAQRVTCSRARGLARPEPAAAKTRRFKRDGFTCRGTKRSGRSIAFTCTRKKMRVTFVWTQK